jgi:hypothetical protein
MAGYEHCTGQESQTALPESSPSNMQFRGHIPYFAFQ